jgi:hypothetical protein
MQVGGGTGLNLLNGLSGNGSPGGLFSSPGLGGPAGSGSLQFDPSSYIPFQETSSQGFGNQITGIYVNPGDPNFNKTGAGMRNGLAPTNMDSFVYEAGGQAELIYGDEGTNNIPPYFGFTPASRINTGIIPGSVRSKGLTTGHGSMMPSAWGYDEFELPPYGEWSMSGTSTNLGLLGLLGNINIPGFGNLGSTLSGLGGLTNGLGSLLGGSNGNNGFGNTGGSGLTLSGNGSGVTLGGNIPGTGYSAGVGYGDSGGDSGGF